MSLPRSEIIAFCNLFAERQDIRATASGSAKGAAIAGLAAFVGALIGGPLGLFIGATVGAVLGGIIYYRKYKPLHKVIKEDLTEAERTKLADAVWAVVQNINPHLIIVAAELLETVVHDKQLERAVFDAMKAFFTEKGISLKH